MTSLHRDSETSLPSLIYWQSFLDLHDSGGGNNSSRGGTPPSCIPALLFLCRSSMARMLTFIVAGNIHVSIVRHCLLDRLQG